MVKVICAGYPKTGTKSLHKALETLGYENSESLFNNSNLSCYQVKCFCVKFSI